VRIFHGSKNDVEFYLQLYVSCVQQPQKMCALRILMAAFFCVTELWEVFSRGCSENRCNIKEEFHSIMGKIAYYIPW
jgi:hypothetical protein